MHINAAWEKRKATKYIWRWFVAWEKVSDSEIAGAVAGYSGGGTFIIERFFGVLDGEIFANLWIDFTDRITGQEIQFETCGVAALAITEKALDAVWDWNNHEYWEETDEIVLHNKLKSSLIGEGEMLYLRGPMNAWISAVCQKSGLTAAPISL